MRKLTDQIASHHRGVIVASFCDGHQQSLANDTNVDVFKHLMTPDGAAYNGPDAPDRNPGKTVGRVEVARASSPCITHKGPGHKAIRDWGLAIRTLGFRIDCHSNPQSRSPIRPLAPSFFLAAMQEWGQIQSSASGEAGRKSAEKARVFG